MIELDFRCRSRISFDVYTFTADCRACFPPPSAVCRPQLLLTGGIGVTLLGGYLYYRFENTLSFDYTGVDDQKEAAEALAGEAPACLHYLA